MTPPADTTIDEAETGLTAPASVRHFLRQNPDFLIENPDLLIHLTPPEKRSGDGVADFQHHMLRRLREETARLQAMQSELLATTRANLNTQSRVHSAVLFLLDARSFEQFIHIVTNDLAVLLDVDAVSLVVEATNISLPGMERGGVKVVGQGVVDDLMRSKPVWLANDRPADPLVFGPASTLVASQALIRLDIGSETPNGLVAFGSRDPAMFHDGQGTELALFLGRVIERLTRAWLL